MRSVIAKGRTLLVVLLLVGLVTGNAGCVGGLVQLLYLVKGNKVDAEFEGLEGKRVAVVCVSSSSGYDPTSAASKLAQLVEILFRQNIKKIELVRQQEVANWIDSNEWNRLDYREIGRGLKVDRLVAIELDGFRLHDDATLYRGRTRYTVTVYDMEEGGEAVFRRSESDYQFPVNGGQHVSETSEEQFQRLFLAVLSKSIAKHFYAYEFKEDFANDAMIAR